MNTLFALMNVAFLVVGIVVVAAMQRRGASFGKRVLAGLGLGVAVGLAVKFAPGSAKEALDASLPWFTLVGSGYVGFLRMIIVPLVTVSIVSAILKLKDAKNLGRISVSVILVLVLTTAVAAAVGAGTALAFKLDASEIVAGKAETDRGAALEKRTGEVQAPLAKMLLDFVPSNPFADMTGSRPASTIALVVFSALVGVAALGIRKKYPEEADLVQKLVGAAYAVTMRLVGIVLKLTPYGVLAIMAGAVIKTDYAAIATLGRFVGASYVALLVMFAVHLIILAVFGLNPAIYVRKAWPVLGFAFSSRSSMATVPLTVEAQNKKLGISDSVANFAATFGTSIGQNGCAGIYPAMLAVMIAPTVGINPLDPAWLAMLVVVTSLSSFGIAGVGGGATFAALMVLSALDLPVALAGLLISVEPLIDMGRTALNVSDAFVAGAVSGRVLGEIDTAVYNSPDAELDRVQG
jgi:L-cystine uptake protein TcyP (sodium:dicarboxylate symporter family)